MCPTSTTIRKFGISHLADNFGLALGLAVLRAATASLLATVASGDSKIDATSPTMMLRDRLKRYSAAKILEWPAKPATSPKRSNITAGKSFILLVTQAPERTA